MSDGDLYSPNFGRPRLSLGNFQLSIDPDPLGFAPEMRLGQFTPRFRETWLNPPWDALNRNILNGSVLVPPTQCSWYAPGSGPSTPRAGGPGDVLKAIYGVPCVRDYVDGRLQWLERRGTAIWEGASTGGRIGLGSAGVVVVGGAVVGGILLGPLSGTDLPIPGIPGLTGRVSLGSDAVPEGLPASLGEGAWSFQLSIDLARLLPALQ